jgi:hypothetical protein
VNRTARAHSTTGVCGRRAVREVPPGCGATVAELAMRTKSAEPISIGSSILLALRIDCNLVVRDSRAGRATVVATAAGAAGELIRDADAAAGTFAAATELA